MKQSSASADLIFIISVISLGVTFFIIGPILSIIALNTLFNLGINLTLGTWFSMFWIHMIIGTYKYANTKKSD